LRISVTLSERQEEKDEGREGRKGERDKKKKRKREEEGERCEPHAEETTGANGTLSGIWEILAARSHLYATPGVASPAIVRPPRRIVALFCRGSLSPVERWQEPEVADRRLSRFQILCQRSLAL